MITPLKTITAITMATGLIAFPAVADGQDNLESWAKEAGREISASMQYPGLALKSGNVGSTAYIVTVDRDGAVVDFHSASNQGKAIFGSASKRAIKQADFPTLPESYDRDQLTFKLIMEYRDSIDPTRQAIINARNRKKGAVTGTRITLLRTTTSVSGK